MRRSWVSHSPSGSKDVHSPFQFRFFETTGLAINTNLIQRYKGTPPEVRWRISREALGEALQNEKFMTLTWVTTGITLANF